MNGDNTKGDSADGMTRYIRERYGTHEETMRAETRQEAEIEAAAGAALIVEATVTLLNRRHKTTTDELHREIATRNQAHNDVCRRNGELRARVDELEYAAAQSAERVKADQKAIDTANAEIARLAKKARVKAVAIPYPIIPDTTPEEETETPF